MTILELLAELQKFNKEGTEVQYSTGILIDELMSALKWELTLNKPIKVWQDGD